MWRKKAKNVWQAEMMMIVICFNFYVYFYFYYIILYLILFYILFIYLFVAEEFILLGKCIIPEFVSFDGALALCWH